MRDSSPDHSGEAITLRGCTCVSPNAMRKNVKGYLISPVPVLWNVEITK